MLNVGYWVFGVRIQEESEECPTDFVQARQNQERIEPCPGVRSLNLVALLAFLSAAAPDSADSVKAEKAGDRTALPAMSRSAVRGGSATAPERVEIRALAARLVDAANSGRLTFVNPGRDRAQLSQLACLEDEPKPPLTLELLRTMDTLAQRSTPDKPLRLMSLFRALSPGRPSEPHGNGQAVDIAAYAGFEIRSANPQDCEEAIVAVIETLGAGAYRLGLPMPLGSEPLPLQTPPDRRADWPFFPPPLPEVHYDLGIVMARLSNEGSLPRRLSPIILRWANARYASLSDIQSDRVRAAIESAELRGANIHSLFPDGTNHLHLDVKPKP